MAAPQKRVEVIPFLHGKRLPDGTVSEPDIYAILGRWLARHPEIRSRECDLRVSRGRYTTSDGLVTEMVRVTIVASEDLAGYDPAADRDLYDNHLAEMGR